jgi:hypothetical protein
MIVAKAVIPDRYWILQKDERKIGNIESGPDGFQVKINNQVQQFNCIASVQQNVNIRFEPIVRSQPRPRTNEVNGYHTTSLPHNAIFDVKHQVPLWTQDDRSKSWFAAGWYRVKQGRKWDVIECPKLIMLERYKYQGPFHTQEEAAQA